jgi:hypothetical protein
VKSDLGHYRCRTCGGVNRHERTCEFYPCPDCGVTTDIVVKFGHDSNCQNYMRPRDHGAALFDDIEQRITQYVFIGEHERAVIVAFIVHCHTIDAFTTTPRIKITSPEENCGKSLLGVDVMGPLLPTGSVLSVSITPAALYRKLKGKTPPTFVLDEFDNTLGRKGALDSETQSTLLAVLNSGYKKGATVDRCVPPSYESVAFPVFAPVVVVGIRPELSKPFETRTIPIEMQRPLPDEYPKVFEWSKETMAESETLRDRISEWPEQSFNRIDGIKPERPDGIIGRKAECWVPLLTVAEAAGGDWPKRLRAAAETLGLGDVEHDGSHSHQLLTDTRDVFGDRDYILSADLIDGLNNLEERRWRTWNDGTGIRAIDLFHRVIKHYKLHKSEDIRVGDKVRKGYERQWFEAAWTRYCSKPSPPEGLPATPATTLTPQGNQPKSNPLHAAASESLHPLRDNGCSDVAGKGPGEGATADTPPENPHESDTVKLIAALDLYDPDHGQKVANLRAEEVRRRSRRMTDDVVDYRRARGGSG